MLPACLLYSARGTSSPALSPPNKALHADGARLGETTVVATLGDRPLGAGAAGERHGVRWMSAVRRASWEAVTFVFKAQADQP